MRAPADGAVPRSESMSYPAGIIARMFDELPDPATCGELTPTELVSAIREYHTAVATSTARVWAFTAKLGRVRWFV